jgi:hypothetical protein
MEDQKRQLELLSKHRAQVIYTRVEMLQLLVKMHEQVQPTVHLEK